MHPMDKLAFCPVCGSDRFAINSDNSKKCEACGFEFFMNASSSTVAIITDSEGRILVERRKHDPAKGTLDLPGGFIAHNETAEEGVRREVMEETGLAVSSSRYMFSLPNVYHYSGIDIHTLDLFFECKVDDCGTLHAGDDAAECMWIDPQHIDPSLFGLHSISKGLKMYLQHLQCKPKER